ncbi:hypothetical protein A2572_02120 [Candidatus Collierbacteria bacterium RIFOXYD1_FULL_40_9]|uniref:Uncharacterized protein n=1 Tax=Candidatus Collierbacteria bacterium RIFOXYD1_FULL_40_9 TaxID=1817731 RepID=A0A1F5FTC5_9BACT|nr:MAG: hypothetical protein A2572_02120 [Candidatus Collierbacteria bacterium RIFOXYD1_FULL_40_9]
MTDDLRQVKISLTKLNIIKMAAEIIKGQKVLDENNIFEQIEVLIRDSEKLLKTINLTLEKNEYIDFESKISIVYIVLGVWLGTSNPYAIKAEVNGYNNAPAQTLKRISLCLEEARNDYFRNSQ